jgi:hypothetical protein
MYKLIYVLLSLFIYSHALAADHYVSVSGSASWAASTNINTPCSVATSMSNASAGDIVYFRGGTYTAYDSDNYHGWWEPAYSGTSGNPIIFMAYPDENPVLNLSTSGSEDYVFGTNGRNYLTYDGFKIVSNNGANLAGIIIYNSTNVTVKNCEFDGGTTIITSADNREALRIENAADITISNCLFYNVVQTSNNINTSAIKIYYTDRITIENCEIHTASVGIYVKRDDQYVTIKNNFLHDLYFPIDQTNNGVSSSNISVYNNIIANYGHSAYSAAEGSVYSDHVNFYNNTVYDGGTGVNIGINQAGNAANVYNNIFYSLSNNSIGTVTNNGDLNTCDHNSIYPSIDIRMHIYGSQATYTSLSSWQSSGELDSGGDPGSGSINTNPNFVTASGDRDTVAEFALSPGSPCLGTGRSGADIGADYTTVGINAGSTNPTITFTNSGNTVSVSDSVTISGTAIAASGFTISSITSSPSRAVTYTPGSQSVPFTLQTNTLSEGINSFIITANDNNSGTTNETWTITYTPAEEPGSETGTSGTGFGCVNGTGWVVN